MLLGKISICIPTYNRAHLLAKCLDALARDVPEVHEIIVGDNCSSDNTPEVIAAFKARGVFPRFHAIRHRENIGFSRNIDSILRHATSEYVYCLNDDDLLIPDSLNIALSLLQSRPDAAAAIGTYLSVRQVADSVQVDYSDASVSIVAQDSHEFLFENLNICDGHPVMRAAAYKNSAGFVARTGLLVPLYFSLLSQGSLLVLNKPLFQHLTNQDSLTSRIGEAWFIDMATADIELAVSSLAGSVGETLKSKLTLVRQRLTSNMYFQGARMALGAKDHHSAFMFLRRYSALSSPSQGLLVQAEQHWLLQAMVERLAQIFCDGEYRSVTATGGAVPEAAADLLLQFLDSKGLPCTKDGSEAVLKIGNLSALEDQTAKPAAVYIHSLLRQLQVSDADVVITLAPEGGLRLLHLRNGQPVADLPQDPLYAFLTAPYSAL